MMNNVIISKLDSITPDVLTQIEKLCYMCDEYEPYYDSKNNESFVHIGAFDIHSSSDTVANNCYSNLVGFLGGIILDDTIDITGIVHPDYRKQGIFRDMLSVVKETFKDKTIIGAVPDSLQHLYKDSTLLATYAYSELLMLLDTCPDELTDANTEVPNSYEFFFSDDYEHYLMYTENNEEPIAVCNLDFSETFTNIYGVFVDEDMRNRGIGTTFIKALITEYFEEFDTPLVLHVTSNNTAAVKLYERCGFHTVESVPYYIL